MTTIATPSLMTAEEFRLLPDNGKPMELVRGVPVEMSIPAPRHGQICSKTDRLIGNYADERDLGHTVSNDAAVVTQRGPDTVRAADIAFYSYAKVPRGPMPLGYIDVPPDLAIEVRSPSDRWKAIINKVNEYLNAGVTLVCVLDEQTSMAHLFPSDRPPSTIAADGELDLSDVLPGFRMPLRRFFE
jgi:Uma2 family endonuclease